MTNAKIVEIVKEEMKNMRSDIVIKTLHTTKTGIFVFFSSQMGIRPTTNRMEYAQIRGFYFHRIQKEQNIINKLRSDTRLYN